MTPKRIDVSIICSVCNKPVGKREMHHDPLSNTYYYTVNCHGEEDSGRHLVVPTETAHGTILKAFPPTTGQGITQGGAAPAPSA